MRRLALFAFLALSIVSSTNANPLLSATPAYNSRRIDIDRQPGTVVEAFATYTTGGWDRIVIDPVVDAFWLRGHPEFFLIVDGVITEEKHRYYGYGGYVSIGPIQTGFPEPWPYRIEFAYSPGPPRRTMTFKRMQEIPEPASFLMALAATAMIAHFGNRSRRHMQSAASASRLAPAAPDPEAQAGVAENSC